MVEPRRKLFRKKYRLAKAPLSETPQKTTPLGTPHAPSVNPIEARNPSSSDKSNMVKNVKRLSLLIASIITALTFAASLIGIAYANWVVEDATDTHVSTVTLDIEVITDTSENNPQYPGADISRAVCVKNTGSDDVFVRIKVVGSFEDAEGNIIPDTDELIQVTYDTQYWKDGADGYYYLRGVLTPGATSETCIDSIVLSTDITRELSGYKARVTPQAEALQITASAVTAVWGKTYEFMEAKQRDPRDEGEAHVTFVDPATGFVFIPTNKDIFPEAKDLTPGESVTHAIQITNAYSDTVSIEVSSGSFTPSSVTELISRYATMTIVGQDGSTVFSGSAAGAAWDAFVHTVTLSPGASVTWKATLTLNPSAPNELQSIDTQILSWNLRAHDSLDPPQPTPGPTPSPSHTSGLTPHTGDNALLLLCSVGALVSGAALMVLAVLFRKQGRENGHD